MRTLVFSIALIVLTILVPRMPAAGGPIAVLLYSEGDVVVQRTDGTAVPATFALQLSAGDVVITGAGSKAEVHFENGAWVELGPHSTMNVKPAKRQPRTNPEMAEKSFQVVQNLLKLKDAEGASSLASLRSANELVELRAESPCQSKIRDGRPTFRWTAANDEAKVRLTINDEKGAIWTYEMRGSASVPYPATAPSLVSGVSYSWSVEIVDPLKSPPVKTDPVFFEVIDPAEEEELRRVLGELAKERRTQGSYHLVRASLFYDHGLISDAIEETKAALRMHSSDALRAVLSQLLTEGGIAQAGSSEGAKATN